MPSTGLPQEVTVRQHMPRHPRRFSELATKSETCNVLMVDICLQKLLRVYCPGHAGVKGNDRADRLVGKATLTNGLLLGRS